MRKVILMLVILGLPTLSHVKAEDQGILLAKALCEYIIVDDRSKIRKKLKRSKVKLRQIYVDTTCNGMSLLKWAEKHNAVATIKFIKTKVKKP